MHIHTQTHTKLTHFNTQIYLDSISVITYYSGVELNALESLADKRNKR